MEKIMERKNKISHTVGLVIGKFAPFHKGHQYLVETAIKKCDEVIAVIYNCPDVINIPLNIRADWIRKIYPDITVIEAWDGPPESGRAQWIKKKQESYIKKVLPKPITHFISSEWYGEHMSKALGAKNVVVDMKRKRYKISGTKIRSNPHKYKRYLHPYVYKDFVMKVVFLGAESSGKTTIARELAKLFKTQWMPEHGRDYWLKHSDSDGKLTPKQLEDLAREHIEIENKKLMKSNKYLFVDTNALTTLLYSNYYHKQATSKLKKMANLSDERYDYWFVCDIDIPYKEDGTRNGEKRRIRAQKTILEDLKKRGIRYKLLTGSKKQRLQSIKL